MDREAIAIDKRKITIKIKSPGLNKAGTFFIRDYGIKPERQTAKFKLKGYGKWQRPFNFYPGI